MPRMQTIALLCCGLLLAAAESARAQVEGIHVSGRGEVLVTPDMARITLRVTRDGQDAAALKKALDDVTRKVLSLTRSLRIDREDVTAAVVNIQPRYRRGGGQSVIDGVTASRTIAVVLRDLDRYGDLMNGALELGVNSVSGTQLDTSKRAAQEEQALELAMRDAQAAAGRIADGFGVAVGRLLNVHVGQPPVQPRRGVMMEAAVAGDDFSPGQLVISRQLQATFAIESR
jgi:uncharacterized protein YggE